MRVVLGWLAIVAVSLGLGVTLYATSLRGSTTGYQESVIPRALSHGGRNAAPRPCTSPPRRRGSTSRRLRSSRPSPVTCTTSQQQRYRVTTNSLDAPS